MSTPKLIAKPAKTQAPLTVSQCLDSYQARCDREGVSGVAIPSILRRLKGRFQDTPLSEVTSRDVEQMSAELLGAPRPDRAARNAEILALTKQGFTWRQIAEKLGVTRFIVQNVRDRRIAGVPAVDAHCNTEGYAPATVQAHIVYLRASMRYAQKKGELAILPYFPTIKLDNARTGFFERDEFERIVTHLPEPYADMVRFGYGCGWRLSEILGLRWSEVDRGQGMIRLQTSKNGHGRCLPLVGELAKIIERRWKARIIGDALSEWVFHRAGKRIEKSSFWYKWNAARNQAGLPGRLFHDLRRTAARDMIAAGCDYQTAMAVTGHRTMSMFMRYQIVDIRGIQHGLEALEAHRNGRH